MLRIGDFARLGRVTVKALRHYDEEGLLVPAEVDPATGYRLYSADQLVVLTRILQLKDLGFSLADIGRLASNPVLLNEALAQRRAALTAAMDADRDRLARLDAALDALAAGETPPAIVVKPVEPVLALTARGRVDANFSGVQQLFETLERDAARAKARAEISPFLLFHDVTAAADTMDVEVCVPVTERGAQISSAREVEGAHSAGAIVYRGSYRQTPRLLAQLGDWIGANGGVIGGPLREVYHRFGAEQAGYRLPHHVLARSADDFVTELIAPLA